jgi:hypothetical protein
MQTRPLFNRFSQIVFLSVLCFTAQSQTNKNHEANNFRVLLESGTPLFLETINDMSTKNLEFGMNICLYLKFPIKVNGIDVLPAGTPAYCRVSRLEKPSGFGKSGLVEIEPLYIQTFKGDILPIGSEAQIMTGRDRSALANSMGLMGSSLGQLAMYQSANMPMQTPTYAPPPPSSSMPEPVSMVGSIPVYDQSSLSNSLRVNNNTTSSIPVPPSDNGEIRSMKLMNRIVGATQVAAAIVPVVAFLIKGKHAKLPKGYIIKTQLISNTVMTLKN